MTTKTIIFLIGSILLLGGALALIYKDVVLKNLPVKNTEQTQAGIDTSLDGLDALPDLNTDELTGSITPTPTGPTQQASGSDKNSQLSEIDNTLGNLNTSDLSNNDFSDFGTVQ